MQPIDIMEPGASSASDAQKHYAIGIDLGTTNSVVAVVKEGQFIPIGDATGRTIIPSIVHYANDKVMVGHEAAQQPDAIRSIKRKMHAAEQTLTVCGARKTPIEISADILKALRLRAERFLEQDVTQAVITVPAYFDDAARVATKDAAQLAGLQVLRLVNEPTAAALAYGLDNASEGIYAVYDLGGGTFDVSILRMEKGVFQVLATGGDTQLGGDDLDAVIAHYLHRTQLPQTALDEQGLAALHLTARALKEQLHVRDVATQVFHDTPLKLSRDELNTLITPLIDKTISIFTQVMRDAGLQHTEIQGTVLVGGSTRLLLVREKITTLTGKNPLINIDPDIAVAMGAALQADALTHGGDTLLLDVNPLSLGLETMGGLVEIVIPRNTPIPISKSQKFTTYQDGQTGMKIHVLQGERELVNLCRSLAQFELTGIPAMPAGSAVIEINFTLDADGILTVSAQETTTGVRQQVLVKPSYGLPPEAMEKMLRDSMEHAKDDITARLLIESRVDAQRAVKEVRGAITKDGDLLSDGDRKLIERKLAEIEQLCAGTDRDAIDYEVQQLDHICADFAEKRVNRALNNYIQGQNVDNVAKNLAN